MASTGRNIGQETLDGLAQLKRGEHGRMTTLPAISEIRERTGLSQSQFSALLGVSVRTLQEWEQGRHAPSRAARTLLIIAAKNPRALVDVGLNWKHTTEVRRPETTPNASSGAWVFRWFVGLAMDAQGMGAHHLHEGPGCWTARLPRSFRRRDPPGGGRGRVVRRPVHGGWHAAAGLGQSQEHRADRPRGADERRGRQQSQRRFSRRAPHQRDASLHNRSRGATGVEGTGARRDPGPQRACAARQSEWLGPQRLCDARERRGRGRDRVLLVEATVRPGSTVGADKGYDQRPFVQPLRTRGITPQGAAKHTCGAIDGRTTASRLRRESAQRKLVEQVFGWMKTVGGLRQVKHRGGRLVDWQVTFAAAAYNLVRLRTRTAAIA